MSQATCLETSHWFLIEAADHPDTLLRVLSLFAVQQAELVRVTLARCDGCCSIRVDTGGLCSRQAQTLLLRLDGLSAVRSVGLGWRAG